jgi:hypothetical protein
MIFAPQAEGLLQFLQQNGLPGQGFEAASS